MPHGRFFTAANAQLAVTNIAGAAPSVQYVSEFMFGTVGSTATGEAGLKVLIAGSTTASGGGVVTTPQTATLAAPSLIGAISTATVPIGAKGYQISVLTGTATIMGTALIPAGVTISSNNTVATAIVVTTAATSTALVAWET